MIANVVGPPGAGKDELAKVLVGQFGFADISTGNILRGQYPLDSKMHRLVEPCLPFCHGGKMVPDELFFPVWKEFLPRIAEMERVVINGFPRTKKQSELFVQTIGRLTANDRLFYVLQLEVSKDECLKRLKAGKRGRADDAFAEQRLDEYVEITLPAISILRSSPHVILSKPIKTEYPGLSEAESKAKVAWRACGILGLDRKVLLPDEMATTPTTATATVAA